MLKVQLNREKLEKGKGKKKHTLNEWESAKEENR